eukprot:3434632-Prymnesium_polylepis.2
MLWAPPVCVRVRVLMLVCASVSAAGPCVTPSSEGDVEEEECGAARSAGTSALPVQPSATSPRRRARRLARSLALAD